MRTMSDVSFNKYFILKQKEFMVLDYTTVDSGMYPILKLLAEQDQIIPLFSCEGHFEEIGTAFSIDSYITLLCKDPTRVIKAFHKLLQRYAKADVEYHLHPTIDYNLLCTEDDKGDEVWYPAYTFRTELFNHPDKLFWLKHLKGCFVN